MKKINKMYFSPTGTTKNTIETIGNRILENQGMENGRTVDFTVPKGRKDAQSFGAEDVLLIGVPVYAGRVPNILLKYLNTIKGKDSLAVPVVLYGNRDYDDALIELNDILIENGFRVIGGASFIGQHSFSKTLAKGRPDAEDLSIARDFADSIYDKLKNNNFNKVEIKGNRPYRKYYKPEDEEGRAVDIRKVEPETDESCIDCKKCVEVCPVGSIDYEDVSKLNGICIKCCACIKICPTESKYFADEDFLRHKHELEDELTDRKEPEIFV